MTFNQRIANIQQTKTWLTREGAAVELLHAQCWWFKKATEGGVRWKQSSRQLFCKSNSLCRMAVKYRGETFLADVEECFEGLLHVLSQFKITINHPRVTVKRKRSHYGKPSENKSKKVQD